MTNLPLSQFYKDRSHSDGLATNCKVCQKAISHKYQREVRRYKKHGITKGKFEKLILDQHGLCALCGKPPADSGLRVDHNHACCPSKESCGACIRGLLCMKCNTGLGMFDDNPSLLRRALEYLEGRSLHV